MKKQTIKHETQITVTNFGFGESIEERLRRATETNEPIDGDAPSLYTERKDGVLPEYDIRTDRWEIAQDAMDKVSRNHVAKREERIKAAEKENNGGEEKTE